MTILVFLPASYRWGFRWTRWATTAAVLAVLLGPAGAAVAAPRIPWTSNRVVGSPNPPAPYAVERLDPHVRIERPIDLAFVPGTQRLLIADQSGSFWMRESMLAPAEPAPFFRMRDVHQPLDSVLGFAFHPGFATNRFLFVNYNEPGGRTNGAVVSRFTFSSLTPPVIDPKSERVIIRWLSGGHNGCTLAFGPDGMLYISTGDAAAPDPPDFPFLTGQDISDLLSSILRIDVNHAEGERGYTVPRDNPFVGRAGARGEVWAFGFRNPFRMSFDRLTGDLWVGDVGWEQWEMIYRIRKGGNYGWALTEGPNLNVRTDIAPGPGPILPPMASIPHTEGASITGGVVYRGDRLPALRGAYVYGDWETGRFWGLRSQGETPLANEELCDTTLKPVAFTLDPAGELIVLDYNGGCYRLVPNVAPGANQAFPRRLSATGIFASLQPLVPSAGVVAYRPAAPMWNDHARADWLLAVPGNGALVTEGGVGNIAGATWSFPENSVLARTLSLTTTEKGQARPHRIETQLLHWDGQAWNPYTYQWNSDQTDATLVSAAGSNTVVQVQDPTAASGIREVPWRFHSRTECLRCHNAWAGETITLNALQLGYVGPTGVSEWDRLREIGVLQGKLTPDPRAPKLVDPTDAVASVSDRARSWLHANCASCHRFGAGGSAAFHVNLDKPLGELRLIDEKPLRGDFGLREARLVASGDPYRSTLFYRISTEGAGHMPHIGSRTVDPLGVHLVGQWIRSLPTSSGSSANDEAGRQRAAVDALVERLGQHGTAPEPDAIAALLQDTSQSLALLDRSDRLRPSAQVALARVAAERGGLFARDLFQRLLPPEQRRATLGASIRPETILAQSGDATRGRALFLGSAQCATCHRLDGEGRPFGPDLAGIGGKYTRAQILEQILQPSKTIAPEYQTTVLALGDDEELSGFVVNRTPAMIRLRDAQLVEHEVPVARIRKMHGLITSAMPEGLLGPLTVQEAADLLEFLAARR